MWRFLGVMLEWRMKNENALTVWPCERALIMLLDEYRETGKPYNSEGFIS
jgi:hypothetical protein